MSKQVWKAGLCRSEHAKNNLKKIYISYRKKGVFLCGFKGNIGGHILKLEFEKSGEALHRNQSVSRIYCQSLVEQANVRSSLATIQLHLILSAPALVNLSHCVNWSVDL